MAIYRITVITVQWRLSFSGLFKSSCEAVEQTLADFPEARSVAAMFIRRAAA